MKNNEFATYYFHQNWGPLFGKINSPDLSIYNKSNLSSKGNWVFRSKNFWHKNYENNDEMYKRFTGSLT